MRGSFFARLHFHFALPVSRRSVPASPPSFLQPRPPAAHPMASAGDVPEPLRNADTRSYFAKLRSAQRSAAHEPSASSALVAAAAHTQTAAAEVAAPEESAGADDAAAEHSCAPAAARSPSPERRQARARVALRCDFTFRGFVRAACGREQR
jgi:hypothetical protein